MEHKEEAVRSKFGRACVFCASSFGGKESYKTAATELGQELVLIFLSKLVNFLLYVYVVCVVLCCV